ncbi:MAG TPA: DNA polymerase ligase N-terminal domain-containing protein [Gammaproteobacteria bacterium]|nr:DNA polymerase ligase N-terminal domain-containing protein [Gammaproteobacteria bacterium]
MFSETLKRYRSKRDFKKSSEPPGRGKLRRFKKNLFTIQKHDASHLHYDFRLRVDDVLASWAVPKGLSTRANEKRLAVRTEDHPLDYADFEGVIPAGQYGGGTVLVWDMGTYNPVFEDKSRKKSMRQLLEEGKLKFNLQGEKLQGGYAMVRTGRHKDKEQWLIFKLDDEYADARRNPVSTQPDSVLTGRSLKEIELHEKMNE